MNNIGYPPVPLPHDFALTMEHHWVSTLGNASSQPLRDVWTQMATAFGRALLEIDEGQWQVLQPPTGSGKTQGTAVYCAMLARENLTAQHPAGVLIVSRLKAQCDEMAKAINGHAGQAVAHVHHSDSMLTNDQLDKAMILVITHAALVKAYEGLTKDTQSRWQDFAYWSQGKRKLVIVDEALNGIVEHSCLTLERLSIALGVARLFQAEHGAEVQALEALYRALEARACSKTPGGSFLWTQAPNELLSLPKNFDFYTLRKSVERVQFDQLCMGTESAIDRQRGANLVVDTLRHAEAVLSRWAFYQQKGNRHTLNSALLLIPEGAPPAVVLDATASQSELWQLLGDRVSIVPVPDGARSYANVSLHVCRAKGMGKDKMEQHANARFARLSTNLLERLGKDRRVFLCTHKRVTPIAWKHAIAKSFAVGHWGAIDGRNDWQDCDTVVIFGLPYRDVAWAKGMLMATKGVQQGASGGDEQADLRRNLQQRQMAVSVIQAINRARCRKALDGDGNCAPTEVYLVLPPDEDGDAILTAIQKEMPSIQIKDWDFKPDGEVLPVRRGSNHEAILAFMAAQPPGETYLTTIKDRLGICDMKPIRTALNDDKHALSISLATMGVTYVRLGSGRATRTLLRKAA